MSFSFNESLEDSISQIRFLLGDITSPGEFSDELINGAYAYVEEDVNEAAAMLAEQQAAKYSKMTDISVDGLSVSYSERASQYNSLADRLRRAGGGVNGIGDPFVGGTSISETVGIENQPDRPRSKFRGIGDIEYPPEIE